MKHHAVALVAAFSAILGAIVLTSDAKAEEGGHCGVYKYCDDECPVDEYGACLEVMPNGCCIEDTDCDVWFPDIQCFGEMDSQIECFYDEHPSPECIWN